MPVLSFKELFSSTGPLNWPAYVKKQAKIQADKLEKQQKLEAEQKAKLEAEEKARQAAIEAAQRAAAEKAAADALAARIAALWAGHPAGNNYTWGNCTWYVANRRSVPLNLGNARDWLGRAQAWGFETGPAPKVGAVAWEQPGWSLGHVAYVEAVYPDGSFDISEMNVLGLNRTDTRHVPSVAGWYFIYLP